MKKFFRAISTIIEYLTVACFIVLFLLVFTQIGSRWMHIQNMGWTDEIVSCFTTWMVYLGYAYMCERDEHIVINMVQDAVPAWMKKIMVILVRIANIAAGAALTYGGYIWTQTTTTKLTSMLQIRYNYWYSSIWICSVLFTVFALVKLLETIYGYIKKEA